MAKKPTTRKNWTTIHVPARVERWVKAKARELGIPHYVYLERVCGIPEDYLVELSSNHLYSTNPEEHMRLKQELVKAIFAVLEENNGKVRRSRLINEIPKHMAVPQDWWQATEGDSGRNKLSLYASIEFRDLTRSGKVSVSASYWQLDRNFANSKIEHENQT